MKQYIKKFQEGVILGVGFLFVIGTGVFAAYSDVPDVTSGTILTATTFNQLLANVRDLKSITDNYSTSETATNKKWIDGSQIYRKVYTTTINSNEAVIAHGLAYAKIIKIEARFLRTSPATQMLPLPFASPTYPIGVSADSTNILTTGLNAYGVGTFYAIVEYIK